MTTEGLSRLFSAVPLFPGKPRLVSAVAKVTARGNANRCTCLIVGRTPLCLDLSDRIERLMWGHCYELHVQRCLQSLLSCGDVFIDVGAHVGYHAAYAASLVGPNGRVFAFEADPSNFARLRDHLGSLSSCVLSNKAVWQVSGQAKFKRSPEPSESGWGKLAAACEPMSGEGVTVETISLDDWSTENCVDRVSVIKIDAEGSEVGILRGAAGLLERFKPTIVTELNEIVLQQADTSSAELIRILCERNYRLFSLSGTSLRPLHCGHIPTCCELLALPDRRQEEAMVRLKQRGFRVLGK